MRNYWRLKKALNSFIVPNIYALHFVATFWSRNNSSSQGTQVGTSLSILLITQFSPLMYAGLSFKWEIWKGVWFLVCFIQILISFLFERKIHLMVLRFKKTRLSKFYWLFILYLIGTMFLLLYLLSTAYRLPRQ